MSSGAQRRLLADLRELERQPLPMVSARPLEHDLFTWHCNLMGPENTPYAGGLFHFVLSFPHNYPNKPPSARVLSPIPHPHVHGDLVCLDLLSDYASYFLSVDSGEKVLGTGWSSAYSVQTILLQMQAFLMELGDESDDAGPYNDEADRVGLEVCLRRIPRAIQKARAFSCHTCPHVPGCPWPPVVTKLEINQLPKKEADIIREELVCFHSRRHFTEDVLGIDISLIWNNRKNEPSEINTNLDLLSYTAYSVDSVRQTVMGDAFTHWLPLYVNEEHGERAETLLRKSLSVICTGNEGRFRPEMAFETLAKLCNTMVVNVMAERTHASLKALSGYCAFQRLILHFARQYPSLVKAANSMVDMFVENESYRTKEVVKALGEFLPLLTITEKSWKDIALAYLYESFDRNVRWMLQKFPMLATTQPDPIVDEKRCALTFESSIVSLRLLLFHVYFLENVGRPEGMSLEDIAQGYDAMYGMPSAKMKESLQEACKQIQQVASWDEYFARIGVKAPTRDELTEWLRQSVANSARKGYHDPRKYSRYLTEKERTNASLSMDRRGRGDDPGRGGRRSSGGGSGISQQRRGSNAAGGNGGGGGCAKRDAQAPRARGRDDTRRSGHNRAQSQSPDGHTVDKPVQPRPPQQPREPPRQPRQQGIDPFTIGDRRRRRDDRVPSVATAGGSNGPTTATATTSRPVPGDRRSGAATEQSSSSSSSDSRRRGGGRRDGHQNRYSRGGESWRGDAPMSSSSTTTSTLPSTIATPTVAGPNGGGGSSSRGRGRGRDGPLARNDRPYGGGEVRSYRSVPGTAAAHQQPQRSSLASTASASPSSSAPTSGASAYVSYSAAAAGTAAPPRVGTPSSSPFPSSLASSSMAWPARLTKPNVEQ